MRTYLDSGVLIAAFKNEEDIGEKARTILEDPNNIFVSSEIVRLEVLVKPIRKNNQTEIDFYNVFFSSVTDWVPLDASLVDKAISEAAKGMMQQVDALHVAAAHLADVEQFFTTEEPTKPMCTNSLISATSLRE